MSYIFMVIHHPKPEHRDDLIRGMVERAELMAATPGFIEAGPWEIENDQRIVGISRWQSKEAFAAAVPPGFGVPTDDVHEWETRPRELFHLESPSFALTAAGESTITGGSR
jgi:Antibiotic biosynthesis monooxygenase